MNQDEKDVSACKTFFKNMMIKPVTCQDVLKGPKFLIDLVFQGLSSNILQIYLKSSGVAVYQF